MLDPLLIRADASPEIGTGHVMRCLALAQTWKSKGGLVHFIGKVTCGIRKRLRDEGIAVRTLESTPGEENDADETARKARELEASWIVVDGYHFDGFYQRKLREEGRPVLFLDDYGHADRYEADLVLNQNVGAKASLYSEKARHTDLLLGPRYALLRKEFWPWRAPRRPPRRRANHVLVTLGGSDPNNITSDVIRALGQTAMDIHVTVAIGGSSLHQEEVRTVTEEVGSFIKLRWNVKDMASLMAKNDIAVSAGGSTCWELAFMGIPNIIVVLAENQKATAEELDEADTAINLGWYEGVDVLNIKKTVQELLQRDEKRILMARRAQEKVDGRGSARVLRRMDSRSDRHQTPTDP